MRRLLQVGLWIVSGVVEATALSALERRTNDEVSDLDEVAQLNEVVCNPEMTVIFSDFRPQQVNAVFGPL